MLESRLLHDSVDETALLAESELEGHGAGVRLWKRSLADYSKEVGTHLADGDNPCADLLRDSFFLGKTLGKGLLVVLDLVVMTYSYFEDAAKCQALDEPTNLYKCLKNVGIQASNLLSSANAEAWAIVEDSKKRMKEIPEDFKKCTSKPQPSPTPSSFLN